MSEKLKPCPFCGRGLILEINTAPYRNNAYHPDDNKKHCILSGIRFPVKAWNARPIEMQLESELAAAKRQIDDLKGIRQRQAECIVGQEKEIERLKA